MFIVMHCSGMPFNGTTISNSSLGGSETSAYYLAKELAKKGHKVTIFTNSQEEGVWDDVKYVCLGVVNENTPLGNRFHFYAENTPHDVLIMQRHPYAFRYNWAAKIKLWHLHDLAQIRMREETGSHMWNVDGVLTVSEFHKKQICETWGFNPEVVLPIQNGVDLSLFEGDYFGKITPEDDQSKAVAVSPFDTLKNQKYADFHRYFYQDGKISLLYTSRPERGLEHLVMEDGIMERLAKIDPKYHLYVCGYDNTTQHMVDYYSYLFDRCEKLPNVTVLGHLTKQELADVMRQCDALVYPTPGPMQPDFEEVSCITAMEAMAAGLPFISSDVGALSETCKDSGSILLPLKDGMPDIEVFVREIVEREWIEDDMLNIDLKSRQLEAAKRYDWSIAADMVQSHIDMLFKKNRSTGAVAKQLMMNSDIYALRKYVNSSEVDVDDSIRSNIHKELDDCYKFAFENTWSEHYESYYKYEAERGVDYGPEKLDGNMRFEHVSGIVASLDSGSVVLDYGCAHGHYTINLAKRFPELSFVGVDITRTNIEKAEDWAKEEGVNNATFVHGEVSTKEGLITLLGSKERTAAALNYVMVDFDAIIAAEVIEHVGTPQEHISVLCKYLKQNGLMIITTPFGPWEAIGYKEHYPWRAHVYHFDRADLHDMWGHFPDFSVAVAPSGPSKWGMPLGSYITTFKKPDNGSITRALDYNRKFNESAPLQTVSLCMVVKDAEATLKQCLDSASNAVDEIVLAIDNTTTDGTQNVIDAFIKDRKGLWPTVKQISIASPLDIGFDEARNLSIAEASGDWIMWLDSDEILVHPDNVFKYLHNNQYDGYAIKQHHFAVEPLGVLKTDLPCRLFRNHKGIKFFGVVHEHPEKRLNEGVGHVQLLHDIEIAHQGYTTEHIRRNRFHRNIDLLVRDRKKYPERVLGKFLWLRDLAQMCKYELELNGGHITVEMVKRADEGIKLWEELLEGNHLRMILDGMEFYSILNKILGVGFEFGLMVESSKANGGIHLENAKPIVAHFNSKEHIEKLFVALTNEKVKDYERKYY